LAAISATVIFISINFAVDESRNNVNIDGMKTLFPSSSRKVRSLFGISQASFHPSNPKFGSKRRLPIIKQHQTTKMGDKTDYASWSHESLIRRVTQLELELKSKNTR
jgi:hypothetical protein